MDNEGLSDDAKAVVRRNTEEVQVVEISISSRSSSLTTSSTIHPNQTQRRTRTA